MVAKDAHSYFLADSCYLAMAIYNLSSHVFEVVDITAGYHNGGYIDNVNDLIHKHGYNGLQ